MLDISTVAGYEAIVQHFGRWPPFHDAVLEKLMLDAHGKFHLSLRTWNTSTDMDERGYFKTTHHATVDFTLSAVQTVELHGTDVYAGSILFGLSVATHDGLFFLTLDPCLGVSGSFIFKDLQLALCKEI